MSAGEKCDWEAIKVMWDRDGEDPCLTQGGGDGISHQGSESE